MIPHRENHLVLDIANSESETELQGNRQIIAPYRGAVSYVQFTTDQRKPWYIQALRPDGSPLTFGYDVLDLQENNIGVVGQGSRLFILSMMNRTYSVLLLLNTLSMKKKHIYASKRSLL